MTPKAEDYSWFDLSVENKTGNQDFICRTIAKSESHAISKLKPKELKVLGSKFIGTVAFKHYIKKIVCNETSNETLSCVDLNNPTHVELLRTTNVISSGMAENYWYVKGDHPTMMRPDKYWLKEREAREIAKNLISDGFENVEFGIFIDQEISGDRYIKAS